MHVTRHSVIFEPDELGHQREWIEHLLQFFYRVAEPQRISLIVTPGLEAVLSGAIPPEVRHRVDLIAISRVEQRWCSHRSLPVSGFARWQTMRRYMRRVGADRGYFMALDHLSLPLALGLRMRGGSVGGILFRPSVHYASFGEYRPHLRERLRDVRKSVLYRLMLRNRSLHLALSLDPYFTVHARNHYIGGDKVHSVSDPAPPKMASVRAAGIARGWVPSGRVGFLLFGVLTERKGILVLLDALNRLNPESASRVAVMLAGRVDSDISAEVRSRIAKLQIREPTLYLRLDDRRLDAQEIEALLEESNVVLAPYQRFVGSSGVLLWAARSGRPLLTQDFGLVGHLTKEHRLGMTTDTADPRALATAIELIISEGPAKFIDRPRARMFIGERTPEKFAERVFASMTQP